MVDELLAADRFYYFPEPTYYRFPTNTDRVFEEYLNNPDRFEEYEIPKDFLILRHHDLRTDLESIGRQGQSKATKHKFYYYKGMVDKLREYVDEPVELGQYDLIATYFELKSNLADLKTSLKMTGEVLTNKINLYYYFKGKCDILKQLILNTPLMVRQ